MSNFVFIKDIVAFSQKIENSDNRLNTVNYLLVGDVADDDGIELETTYIFDPTAQDSELITTIANAIKYDIMSKFGVDIPFTGIYQNNIKRGII